MVAVILATFVVIKAFQKSEDISDQQNPAVVPDRPATTT